ncbi:MAG: hypothetical protein ACR2J5_02535 [Geodermatophilaceae bacterium]
MHLFTRPCGPLIRTYRLSDRGTGAGIETGALMRQGLRLYGVLLAIEGGRMTAAPGLYLGCQATELDLSEPGVTSVIWSDCIGEPAIAA